MKISIIGSGHVGLVTGAGFADIGHEVICMDHDAQKIKMLARGKIPFYEPGLLELVRKNSSEGRLQFTTSVKEAVRCSTVLFLCVGTPPKDDGEADLTAIENVARSIGQNLTEYRLVVEKSTVPVETGAQLRKMIVSSTRRKINFDVAANAEFLREGTAVHDFYNPDRIILGVETPRAKQLLLEIYKSFKVPVLVTDVRSAEMIKHASNSFLAMKISYINLISQMCEKIGADIVKVAEGMGTDRRIGKTFLNAGIGFGGSCFPKDLVAFIKIGEKLNVPCNLLQEVVEINQYQKIHFVKKVERAVQNLKGKTLGVLGLAFKPDTDDIRNSPAIDILEELKNRGAKIKAYDPCAMAAAKSILKKVQFAKNPYQACRGADAVLVLTEWREFRDLDLKKLKRSLKKAVIVDGRNIYDPAIMKKNGFRYYSIGR